MFLYSAYISSRVLIELFCAFAWWIIFLSSIRMDAFQIVLQDSSGITIIQCTASLLKCALVNINLFSQILSEMEIIKS